MYLPCCLKIFVHGLKKFTGAIIVRPDGFIGWRSQGSVKDAQEAEQTLTEVLTTLLFR
jgi:soluble cytochrome b562